MIEKYVIGLIWTALFIYTGVWIQIWANVETFTKKWKKVLFFVFGGPMVWIAVTLRFVFVTGGQLCKRASKWFAE